MSVGIGLDDGQQIDVGTSKVRKKAEVIFEGAGTDFDPARARMHRTVQVSV